MAQGFDVVARLRFQAPNNLRPIVSAINRQLNGITATVNVTVNPNALRNTIALNRRINDLSLSLASLSMNAKTAETAVIQLGAAFASVNGSAASFAASMKTTQTAMNNINKTVHQSSQLTGNFAEQLGVAAKKFITFSAAAGVIAGVATAARAALGDFLNFQKELIRLEQVGGDTKEVVKGIGDEVTRLAVKYGVSSESILKSASTLRQAGLSATETKVALEALAKTELAPSFDNIGKTTEGVIALMAQFKFTANDLEGVLGSINSVSNKYAVESGDLIDVIKRTGGAFNVAAGEGKGAKERLAELLAIFTSIRATTREAPESIATGLTTIFSRIQTPEAAKKLKDLGISLQDLNGQFVGPIEASRRLNTALQNLATTDQRYARIVQIVGGARQSPKVVPLIQQTALAQEVYNEALKGQDSLTKDAITSQEILLQKFSKLKEEFFAFTRGLLDTTAFKAAIDGILGVTSAIIKLLNGIKSVIPLIVALGAFKLGGVSRTLLSGGIQNFSKGFSIGRANGGSVPGVGSGDTVPAMLTPGEFVIRKAAAQKIGYQNLARANKYATGGIVSARGPKGNNRGTFGMFTLEPNIKEDAYVTVPKQNLSNSAVQIVNRADENISEVGANVKIRGVQGPKAEGIITKYRKAIGATIAKLSNTLLTDPPKFKPFNNDEAVSKAITPQGMGRIFEASLLGVVGKGPVTASSNFDFAPSDSQGLSDLFGLSNVYADAKYRDTPKQRASMVSKAVREFGIANFKTPPKKVKPSNSVPLLKGAGLNSAGPIKGPIKRAGGGFVPGVGDGDTVPAMLTPGEFVIRKAAAKKIGYENLARANKYAKGGIVGYAHGGVIRKNPQDVVARQTIFETRQNIKAGGRATATTDAILKDLENKVEAEIISVFQKLKFDINDTKVQKQIDVVKNKTLFGKNVKSGFDKNGELVKVGIVGMNDALKNLGTSLSKRAKELKSGDKELKSGAKGRFGRLKDLNDRIGSSLKGGKGFGLAVGASLLSSQILGTEDNPGALGKGGAKAGEVGSAALAGAVLGAQIGSIIPVFGTAVGAVVGGLFGVAGALGTFTDKANEARLNLASSSVARLDIKANEKIFKTDNERNSFNSKINPTLQRVNGFNAAQINQVAPILTQLFEKVAKANPEKNFDEIATLVNREVGPLKSAKSGILFRPGDALKEVAKGDSKGKGANKDIADRIRAIDIAAEKARFDKKVKEKIDKTESAFAVLGESVENLSRVLATSTQLFNESIDNGEARTQGAVLSGKATTGNLSGLTIAALGGDKNKENALFAASGGGLDQLTSGVREAVKAALSGSLVDETGAVDNERSADRFADTLQGLIDSGKIPNTELVNRVKENGSTLISDKEGGLKNRFDRGDIGGITDEIVSPAKKFSDTIKESNKTLVDFFTRVGEELSGFAARGEELRQSRIGNLERANGFQQETNSRALQLKGDVVSQRVEGLRITSRSKLVRGEDLRGSVQRFGSEPTASVAGARIFQRKSVNNTNASVVDTIKSAAEIAADQNITRQQNNLVNRGRSVGLNDTNALNPEAVAQKIRNNQAESAKAQNALDAAGRNPDGSSGGTLQEITKLKTKLSDLSTSTIQLQGHLKDLGDSSALLSAAQEKLSIIQNKVNADAEARQGLGKTLAFGGRKEQQKFAQNENLLQSVASGRVDIRSLNENQKSDLGQFAQETAGLQRRVQTGFTRQNGRTIPKFTEFNGQDFINNASNQALQANGIARNNPNLLKQERDATGQLNVVQQRATNAVDATNQLGQDNLNQQKAFLDENMIKAFQDFKLSVEQLNIQEFSIATGAFGAAVAMNSATMGAFSQDSNNLANAMNNFPKSIQIEQNGRVEVIINGAETVAKIVPQIRDGLVNDIMIEVQKQLPSLLKGIPA